MVERILFEIKINIDDLNLFTPRDTTYTGIYTAEVVVDEKKDFDVTLKIFFKNEEYLGEKVMAWLNVYDEDILKRIEILKIYQPDNLRGITFNDYTYKGITVDSALHEGNLKYFEIGIRGIKLTYENSEREENEFFLNQQAFELIEKNYRYHSHLSWHEEPYRWEPENKIKEFLKFNKILFKPGHHFQNINNNKDVQVTIKKEPMISVKYAEISEQEIKDHITLLCSLYSFYSHEVITFNYSRIYSENELHIEVRDVNQKVTDRDGGIFRFDFFNNPLNLILNVNSSHLLNNLNFVTLLINRFNYALETSGESKFMILYNILEQLRNQYILDKHIEKEKAGENPNLKKVVEEYRFKTGKNQTNKYIKSALESVSEIIEDEQKELFRNEIPYKLTPIKVMSMVNQFKSFFEFIELDPENFELEFTKLKSLRDSIFHGRPINENEKYLQEINKYNRLPKFVGVVMLKYFGINLSDIKRINN